MPKKSEEKEKKEVEKKSTTKKSVKAKKEVNKDENSKRVVRERLEKGPNGETIRIRETIIEEDDDNINAESSSDKMLRILTSKKFIIGVGIVLALLIVMVVVLISLKPEPVPEYIDTAAKKGDLYNSIDAGTATLQSSSEETIKSNVNMTATVKEVRYKKGSTVKEGDILLVLDSTFAAEEVRRKENAISSMEKMLELYKRKNEELTIKTTCDGYVIKPQVQKDTKVYPNSILAYYIPTTTFRVEYNVAYDINKAVTYWQTVNIKVAGQDNITGIIYDVDNSTMDQGYVKIVVYVNDSPINLSGQQSTAEVVTSTGNINSNGIGVFDEAIAIPIYSTQEGTISSGIFEEGKKLSKGDVIFNIQNEDITSKVTKYENDIMQLKTEVNFTRSQVNNFNVTSFVSGTVISEPLKVGDSVIPNKELVQLKTTNLIDATVNVSAENIQKIYSDDNINKKVLFNITGEKDKYIYGVITYAQPYSSTDIDKEYEVKAKVDEKDANEEIIGKTAKIEIVLEEATNAVYVPIKSIITEKNYNYVEVKNKLGGYDKRKVTIGLETDKFVQIIEGVNEGEIVKTKNK